MLKRKGRPKEPKAVKLNPPNVILPISETATTGTSTNTSTVVMREIKYKCDNPKCPSEAIVHINARYCKLCAQDKGFCLNE